MGESIEEAETDPRQLSCSGYDNPPIATRNTTTSSWQLPLGVSAGTWDYVRGHQIAQNYDQFLADTPLTSADWKILDRYLPAVEYHHDLPTDDCCVVADLGCGTGRHVLPLAENGYFVLAVDLSLPMLNCLIRKSLAEKQLNPSKIWKLQANLVEMEAFKTDSVDHAICMFSTIGMIKGRENRRRFLDHVRRILKSQGQFILHVHNFWYQVRHPGGSSWLITNAFRSAIGQCELGDRYAAYRGVKKMFIHSFRKLELKSDLRQAGFSQSEWFGVESNQSSTVENPNWRHAFQLVGWVVVCR